MKKNNKHKKKVKKIKNLQQKTQNTPPPKKKKHSPLCSPSTLVLLPLFCGSGFIIHSTRCQSRCHVVELMPKNTHTKRLISWVLLGDLSKKIVFLSLFFFVNKHQQTSLSSLSIFFSFSLLSCPRFSFFFSKEFW